MKKLTGILLASAAVLLTACGPSNDTSSTETAASAQPRKVVIGLDDNFPPMGFRDEKNELVGFDIDLAREAAKRLGVEVEFKPIDWSAKEARSEEHTSELQSRPHLVCRLLLEKKKKKRRHKTN